VPTKPAVDENSTFVTYPVMVSLNDIDGSETFDSVVIAFSTPGNGSVPAVNFVITDGIDISTNAAGDLVITGTTADIEAALETLQISPGLDNGEDITVNITATAIESDPSEVGGDEVAVLKASASSTFVIPVNPIVSDAVTFSVSTLTPRGIEDQRLDLGRVVVAGISDTDGSERAVIEIDKTSFPPGSIIYIDGVPVNDTSTGDWLRIPGTDNEISIETPLHFSGSFDMSVRAVIEDTTSDGDTAVGLFEATLQVTIDPVADIVVSPSKSIGVEDNETIPFGDDIASSITLADNGANATNNNNDDTETISRVALQVPADTVDLVYNISGFTGSGSASIIFDDVTRTYVITSSILENASDLAVLSLADRETAESDILEVLKSFEVKIGPMHTDTNGEINVTIRTLDVNVGVADELDTTFTHEIIVQAVADPPGVEVVSPTLVVDEDGDNIPLSITASKSADSDGSEQIFVRITVPKDGTGQPIGSIVGTTPAGVTLRDRGNGVFEIRATRGDDQETLLNSFLTAGGIEFDPRLNYAGWLTGDEGLKVEVISVEDASGGELANGGTYGGTDRTSKRETATAYIDIEVLAIADTPDVQVKGNAFGYEDELIDIPVSVTLDDLDGSESYYMTIDPTNIPIGTKLFGAGGAEILVENGVYNLTKLDVDELELQAPLHYSSALQGDIVLETTTVLTDTTLSGSDTATVDLSIDVQVIGVSDQPNTGVAYVLAEEDQYYDLGSAIGSVDGILVDRDGSEALSLVLEGLPPGVQPISNYTLGYLGGGRWSVPEEAVAGLKLPPVENFSGEDPYPDLKIKAVSQEMDGDQSESEYWDITIDVLPVIQGTTEDGFASWSLSWNGQESQIENDGTNVPLSQIGNHAYADNDGSEVVLKYYFNLTNVLDDAQIRYRLMALSGNANAGMAELRAYINGAYFFDEASGMLTVEASDIGGISLSSELFLDSNVDFTIPVAALVRDTAVIDGVTYEVEKNETGSFSVGLAGSADVPIAFANDAQGSSLELILMNFGGYTTDTDADLGRDVSEELYYVVKAKASSDFDEFLFVNADGGFIGSYGGPGSWLFTAEDMTNDIYFQTNPFSNGTVDFEFTAIALDDATRAQASVDFSVQVEGPGTGTNSTYIPPLPPTLIVGESLGTEDNAMTLNVSAIENQDEVTRVALSVAFDDVPTGFKVEGAFWDPANMQWIASIADYEAGRVTIIPPKDYSGNLELTMRALAVNEYFLTASGGDDLVSFYYQPVADGVNMSVGNKNSNEDELIDLDLRLNAADIDGSENVGDFVYIQLSDDAVLQGYSTGTYMVNGTELVGYYRVLRSEVSGLTIMPAFHWHGPLQMIVWSYSYETLDTSAMMWSTGTFVIDILAFADAPLLTVPSGSVIAFENIPISNFGLSATLVDDVDANGGEVLSAKITGVPDDSFFNFGSNTGNNTWVIHPDDLPFLELTPPPYWSGTMNLTLTGITYESSNLNEAYSSEYFIVQLEPTASDFLILVDDADLKTTDAAPFVPNIRMLDTRGTDPGETPQEIIHVTLTNVPAGINFRATGGGRLVDDGDGSWVFSGNQDQSNALEVYKGPGLASSGNYDVGVIAATQDGSNIFDPAKTDTFRIFLDDASVEGLLVEADAGTIDIVGGAGNDVLVGYDQGPGSAILMAGTAGTNTFHPMANKHIMTSGTGADKFVWSGISALVGETDEIELFNEMGGDQLDLTGVMDGTFDLQTSNVNEFVKLVEFGDYTVVQVYNSGVWEDVVILRDTIGLNVDQLYLDGALLL